MARPTGVTILAILALIGGVFSLLAGILAMAGGALLGGIAASTTDAQTAAAVGIAAIIIGLMAIVGGVLNLVFFFGAWTAKGYGWILGMISALWNIVTPVVGGLLAGNLVGGITSNIIGIAIAAIILYYLNTPAVKTYFGRA
ncbi:MAG: hypothetical protein WCK58_14355 [Chloroflexota bacterium]